MRKVILIFMLVFGLYPVVDGGRLQLAVAAAPADSWGNEDDGGININDIYNSMSNVFGLDIVGMYSQDGYVFFELGDGSIFDPNAPEVQSDLPSIDDVIENDPDMFPPGEPQSDPDSYGDLNHLLIYINQQEPSAEGKKDPCDEAKALAKALNDVLQKQSVNDQMNALKGMDNSTTEHSFAITRDAQGNYHATQIFTGDGNSTTTTTADNETLVMLIHTHPDDKSAAPSSTDILGLDNQAAGFAGSIIFHGNDMYMLSVTDQQAYDKFVQKAAEQGWYDKDSNNGWKDESTIDKRFDGFALNYAQMHPDLDATYPTQLEMMKEFKMGGNLTDMECYKQQI